MKSNLTFKIASEKWEFDEIHRLNYKTFVEEIPQHDPNSKEKLVDKFHDENTYLICAEGDSLLGMVAIRDKRPFSLDQKLDDLNSYLPEANSLCEIRLLSIERERRSRKIIHGLFVLLANYCESRDYELAVISANVDEMKLYRNLGFSSFGPVVGTDGAKFQPMYLTPDSYRKFKRSSKLLSRSPQGNTLSGQAVNLLPGPVAVKEEIREVFSENPVSHRSKKFVEDFQETKDLLCSFTGSENVEILSGSGTLANDAVAAQISLLSGKGLILSNGEFGERLIDHASRFRLRFERLEVGWGSGFDYREIRRILDEDREINWLWAVHCETSTGVLNEIERLNKICSERGVRLCMDCISSIGAVPLDLNGIYLASGVSGKSLGAYPGLSFVFYNHEIKPQPKLLPRYLDLGFYGERDGIAFSVSSNLLYALRSSLEMFEPKRFDQIAALNSWLREQLKKRGFSILASEKESSPAVVTIPLPESISSDELGKRLEDEGYLLSYSSPYLLSRNWIQISLMGETAKEKIASLLDLMEKVVTKY